ncbi:hypothetical protein Esti_000255 [Eimeria stiedai]
MWGLAVGGNRLRASIWRLTACWCVCVLVFLSWAAWASEGDDESPEGQEQQRAPPPPPPPAPTSSDYEVVSAGSGSESESAFDSAEDDSPKDFGPAQAGDDVQGSPGSPASSSSDSSFEAFLSPLGGDSEEEHKPSSGSPENSDESSSESFEAVGVPSGAVDPLVPGGLSDVESFAASVIQNIGDGLLSSVAQDEQEGATGESVGGEEEASEKLELRGEQGETGTRDAPTPPRQQVEAAASPHLSSAAPPLPEGAVGASGQPPYTTEEEKKKEEGSEETHGRDGAEEAGLVKEFVALPLGAPGEEGQAEAPAPLPEAAAVHQKAEATDHRSAALSIPLGASDAEPAVPTGALEDVSDIYVGDPEGAATIPVGGPEGAALAIPLGDPEGAAAAPLVLLDDFGADEGGDEGGAAAGVGTFDKPSLSYLSYHMASMKFLHKSITLEGDEVGDPLVRHMIREHMKHRDSSLETSQREDFSMVLIQNTEVVGGFLGFYDPNTGQVTVHDLLIAADVIDRRRAARVVMQAIVTRAYELEASEVSVSCSTNDFASASLLARLGFVLKMRDSPRAGKGAQWNWSMILPPQRGYFPSARYLENETRSARLRILVSRSGLEDKEIMSHMSFREREKFAVQSAVIFGEATEAEQQRATRFVRERVRGTDDPLQRPFLLGSENTYAYISSLEHDLSVVGVLGAVCEGNDVVVQFWGVSSEVEDYTSSSNPLEALLLSRLMGDAVRDNKDRILIRGVPEDDIPTLRVLFDMHFQAEKGDEGLTFTRDVKEPLLTVGTILASYRLKHQEQALLSFILRYTLPEGLQEAGVDHLPAELFDALQVIEATVKGKSFIIKERTRALYGYVGLVALALALLLVARQIRKGRKRQEVLQRLRQRIIREATEGEGERAVTAPVEQVEQVEEVVGGDFPSLLQP